MLFKTPSLRRLQCIVLVLAFAIPWATALAKGGGKSSSTKPRQVTPGKQYDAQGRYAGRVDNTGRRYDSQGRYLGRMDEIGRQFNSQGRYLGRIDETGRQYDSQGRFLGRTDAKGRLYDEQGRYQGRMDAEGRQFDVQGRYIGRVEPSDQVPDFPLRNDVAGARSRLLPVRPDIAVSGSARESLTVAPFVLCDYGDKACLNSGPKQ